MPAKRVQPANTAATPVGALRHDDKRVNIPTGELRGFAVDDEQAPEQVRYPRDPSLDPQLVWRGKDEQDSEDLAVPSVPIYVQEKIVPQAIVENLRRTAPRTEDEPELSLFDDFDRLEFGDLVDFYAHEANWSNRMILGDSLLAMTSLAEKEGLRGTVQMIYLDPPYGIRFGSNWQVSTRKRDLAMGDTLLKATGAGNLFTVFGEPDVAIERTDEGIVVEIQGVDVYDPTTGTVRSSSSTDDIACWFLDTDYDEESFFVRHAYFTGADEPYKKLQRALRVDIDADAWSTLYRTRSQPFRVPLSGKIAVKVINHYGDEVLKVYEV